MSRKVEVMELLRQGREEELAELVASDRRAVRHLTGRLWDSDAEIRRRAARAVGMAAGGDPRLGKELIRRMLWALNDESATNGVYALAALGQIGRSAPALLAPHVSAMVSMVWDDNLRAELFQALIALAGSAPELVYPHLSYLKDYIDPSRPREVELFNRLEAAGGKEPRHGH